MRMKTGTNTKESMLMNWPERVWIYSPVRKVFLWLHARKWAELTGPLHGASALEIGCGLGKAPEILIRNMGFQQVVAFDLEEILIRRAHRRITLPMKEDVSFFVGDAQDLPFGDAAFEAVVNYGIIHHVIDWRRAIAEIGRVLKPGGFFYFEEIYPPLYANFLMKRLVRHPREDRFDGFQFIESLSDSGMRLVQGVNATSKFAIVGAAQKC
jgi:ubiquinone/menaquinone biosynthesis C-methylase UbiE